MTVTWQCLTCEVQIEADEIAAHEAKGHDVRGHLVPDRLLTNDLWHRSAAAQNTKLER
ncbi:MAG: hypothetical protein ABEJ60_02435 [Halodesulfurarchaeum sp.]